MFRVFASLAYAQTHSFPQHRMYSGDRNTSGAAEMNGSGRKRD